MEEEAEVVTEATAGAEEDPVVEDPAVEDPAVEVEVVIPHIRWTPPGQPPRTPMIPNPPAM